MKYLLDTNVCIDVLKGRTEVVMRLSKQPPDNVAISAVTVFELIQGAERAPVSFQEAERAKVARFLSMIPVVPLDVPSGTIAGEINAALLKQGTPVSIADVFIAATALAMKIPVVTSNEKDFLRIPGLEVIDWRD